MRCISPTQIKGRKDKALYYYCDDKYQLGHRYNKPKNYMLEGMETVEEGLEEEGITIAKNED